MSCTQEIYFKRVSKKSQNKQKSGTKCQETREIGSLYRKPRFREFAEKQPKCPFSGGMVNVPITRIFLKFFIYNFSALVFSFSYVKTNSDRREILKNLKLDFFRALKCSYFVLKVSRRMVTN